MSEKTDDILFEEILGNGGSVGLITLRRPSSLNALTKEMCVAIDQKLGLWQNLGHIKAVAIRGEGDRAFCAGGDVRFVYDQGRAGIKKSRNFFWHEYRMNHRIFHFSKPFISLMHGITMGGGAGISIHGTHRVASENLVFAMPETSIGFFPDIGASYFLPRCTGKMGYYIGLTGTRLHIADAIYAGLVDHLVPKKDFEALIATIADTKFNENIQVQVSDIISSFSMDVDSMDIYKPHLLEHRAEINQCFAPITVEEIFENLSHVQSPWGQVVMTKLLEKSPTSLKVTLRELQHGAHLNFDDCMKMEFRIAQKFLTTSDFYEGVRAALIDKDQNPIWRPDTLEEVSATFVEDFFTPKTRELTFEEKVEA